MVSYIFLFNMEKLFLLFSLYFVAINVGECRIENKLVRHLAFLDGERFTCIGVLLSLRHALFNGNCVFRRNFTTHGNLEVIAGDVYSDSLIRTANNYRRVIRTVLEDNCLNKKRSHRIQNCLAVLTLESGFQVGNNLQITKLPTGPIARNTVGSIVGWYHKCSTRSDQIIIAANVSIVAKDLCSDLQPDEFCAMDTMTERIHASSPVISGDTIIGFSTVGCHYSSRNNPVTDLYLHNEFLTQYYIDEYNIV